MTAADAPFVRHILRDGAQRTQSEVGHLEDHKDRTSPFMAQENVVPMLFQMNFGNSPSSINHVTVPI